MANFVAIVDADAERRRRFVRQIRTAIAPFDGLRIDTIEQGDFAAVWAAQDRAPLSQIESATAVAMVWGEAFPPRSPDALDASQVMETWKPTQTAPPAFDGFYAALRFDAHDGLTLGADLLGFLPIYYAVRDGALVAGTSPELFAHHPSFPARLDPTGLAGTLLTHAPFDGRTLLDGVRRLSPGHVLTWRQASAPNEVSQYTIPRARANDAMAFEEAVAELDASLATAIGRFAANDRSAGMLLSGGRDSRLVAGYLREHGRPIHALTLGAPSDHEMRCAAAVARALGCTHRAMRMDDAKFPVAAEMQTRWEHLNSGFANVHMWGTVEPLRDLPPRVFTGHHLEIRSGEPFPSGFDALVSSSKNRGIPSAVLRRLMRSDGAGDVITDVDSRRRAVFEAAANSEAERAARFFTAHYYRAHAGGVPWKLSFGSWPVLPILDRALLETILTLPASTLANRRAQDEILRRRFPDLARLPLDRNTHSTLPLIPSFTQRIRHAIGERAEPLRRRVPRQVERRYYHRVYDINGRGWRGIRHLAEPHRERLAGALDMDVLHELVPPPDAYIPVQSTISEHFDTKLLIGLMLWSAHHPI
ncbi:MAG: asparagine synthase-related protein [Gemmatimonadaceae bacterium]